MDSTTATWDARYPKSVYSRAKLSPENGSVIALDLAFVGLCGDLKDIGPILAKLLALEYLDLSNNLCLTGDYTNLVPLQSITQIYTRFCPMLSGDEDLHK